MIFSYLLINFAPKNGIGRMWKFDLFTSSLQVLSFTSHSIICSQIKIAIAAHLSAIVETLLHQNKI